MPADGGAGGTAKDELAAYPRWLRDEEASLVAMRRRAAAREPASATAAESAEPRIGLALSGGGIRSATFCLGVLQALARAGHLRAVDYLSTVSGGGYAGAFLGGLYVRRPSPDDVEKALTDVPDSFPVAWLRDNGRYLAPNGAGASWIAGAILLRNWVALLVVLFGGALTFTLFAEALHVGLLSAPADVLGRLLPWERHAVVGGLWPSPLLVLPLLALAVGVLPPAVGYWFVPVERRVVHLGRRTFGVRWAPLLLLGVVLAAVACGGWAGRARLPAKWDVGLSVAAAGGAQLLVWLAALGWSRDASGQTRYALSRSMARALEVTLVLFAIALADTFGQTLYERWIGATNGTSFWKWLGGLSAAVASVVLSANRVLAGLGALQKRPPKIPLSYVTLAVALALLGFGMATLSFLAHLLLWDDVCLPRVVEQLGGRCPAGATHGVVGWRAHLDAHWLVVAAAAVVAVLVIGRFYAFVNGSSLHAFYAGRLTRAYLGASNDVRAASATAATGTEPIPGDGIDLDEYAPHVRGGPIHLVNATINETVDPRVQVRQPDRRGVPLALGPRSLSVGVRHHAERLPPAALQRLPEDLRDEALWLRPGVEPANDGAFRVFRFGPRRLVAAERLDLGDWLAISGAAVAPGSGVRTRLGNSLLLGMLNMRLGYWWDSGIDPPPPAIDADREGRGSPLSLLARWFPVYAFLTSELFARFGGTSRRHWYLSDGGHFDNTGAYELIRRRLPVIVCSDAGADPEYRLDDLANLVRLARVDFGAEITFLSADEIAQQVDPAVADAFGAIEELRSTDAGAAPGRPGKTPHAALARIRYAPDPAWPGAPDHGVLVVLKPTVCGAEPLDVRGYRAAHPDFPQETTVDQFFDDAQWEAYRRLGEHIGARVFARGFAWMLPGGAR